MHDHRHVVVELLERIGVVLRVTTHLIDVLLLVLAEQQIVAILHRGQLGLHQQRLEPVLYQLQLLDDLRSQLTQGVGERRELEAGMQLFGYGGTTDGAVALDDQRVEPGLGQIGAVDEPVVTTADHDRVIG